MSIVCKNCGTSVDRSFCPECGQKATTGRLTVKHVLEEGWHSVTHTDRSFLSLLGLMLRRPGRVISDYIGGQRKKYFNPYMFYVVVTGLLIFIKEKVFAREDNLYHIKDEWGQLVNKEYELLVLFSIPLMALFFRLIYLRRKYNYAEWVTVLIFAYGLINFGEILIQLLYLPLIRYHFHGQFYTDLIDYVILAYVLISVVRPAKWWHWLQIATTLCLVYVIINYIASPVTLLLHGYSWEAVQYSF